MKTSRMHISKTDCVYMPYQLNLWHWTDSLFLENMGRFLDCVDPSELLGHFAQMVTPFYSEELWGNNHLLCGGSLEGEDTGQIPHPRAGVTVVKGVLAFKAKSTDTACSRSEHLLRARHDDPTS